MRAVIRRQRAPVFDGAHLPGVLTLRTIADARQVYDLVRLRGLKTAVVLGGGALGLEWAHALLEQGVKVTLIERAPRFLPGALDEVGSDLLAARLRKAGIDVLFNEEVRAAHPGPRGGVAGISLASGRALPCELVCAALGVVPNAEFLANTGLALAPNGAVEVDRKLRSSQPNVWAAGDVARVEGEWLALWEPARSQARVAARNMSGGSLDHLPGVHYFATRLFDLDFARIGQIERREGRQEIVDFPRGTGQIAYRKLVFSGGRLVGALMLGERALKVRAIGRNMKRLVDAAVDVSEIQHRLLDPSFDVEAWLERKKLVERPAPPAKTTLVEQAKLKRTQAIRLGSMSSGTALLAPATETTVMPSSRGTALSAQSGGTAAIPSGPRRTKVLSIGLHAEEAPVGSPSLAPLDARLEFAGRMLPITLQVTNLGQSPQCQVPLSDPALSAFHAQILRYDTGLYLRDLGSSTGTWVNGRCLFGPHALCDGDRIRLGQIEIVFRSTALLKERTAAAQRSVGGPCLEVRSGGSLGLSFALGANVVRLGSAPECAIRLNDPSVSTHHAEFRAAGNGHTVSDLGSFGGTFVRGARIAPGQIVALSEGDWLRFGAVDLLYTSAARPDAMASLRARARIVITSGTDSGKSADVGERLIVGSDPRSGLVLGSVAPAQLELATHAGKFWVRDLSGGRAFRAGSPLGPEFSEIQHGELLLLSGTTMLRFEEAP